MADEQPDEQITEVDEVVPESSNIVTLENRKPPVLSPQQENEITTYLKGLGASLKEEQMQQFVTLCREFQLNPFKREIYGIPYGDKFNIIVGYEVYIKRAERSQKLDGWERGTKGEGQNMTAWIKIYRKDWGRPFYHEVDYKEYVQTMWDYDQQKHVVNAIWASKPKTMLMKVVTAQAFRLAFPDEFAGMPYTSDEMPIGEGTQSGLPQGLDSIKDTSPSAPSPGIKMSQTVGPPPSQAMSPGDATKNNIWDMLQKMYGEGAADKLEELTSFWSKRDNKQVPGKRDISRVSQKQASFMVEKVQKEYDKWCETQGHVEEVPEGETVSEPLGTDEEPPPYEDDDMPF
jgi:phage recombination protein Bet